MPDTDNEDATAQPAGDPSLPQGSGRERWWCSLWFWPALAIALATIAGTYFGAKGSLLTFEALTAILVSAGVLVRGNDRWLTFGLAVVLAATLVSVAGTIRRYESAGQGSNQGTVKVSNPLGFPVHWPQRVISQAMADDADFRGADLDGASLNGLQLSHVNFDGVQANGASFRGSQLEYASLRGASLKGACLAGANLTGADLTGADLSGADVAGVTVSRQAKEAALVWPTLPAVTCG